MQRDILRILEEAGEEELVCLVNLLGERHRDPCQQDRAFILQVGRALQGLAVERLITLVGEGANDQGEPATQRGLERSLLLLENIRWDHSQNIWIWDRSWEIPRVVVALTDRGAHFLEA